MRRPHLGVRLSRKAAREAREEPFKAALESISKMEQAVFTRTTTRDFTVADVARFLWPAEIVNALQAAFPFIRTIDRSEAADVIMIGIRKFKFTLRVAKASILAAAPGLVAFQVTPKSEAILQVLHDIVDINDEFNIVRECVQWCNNHTTPAAARYYFPSLGSLLPADHAFHMVQGDRFRESTAPVSDISKQMRTATTIIAKGLLCNPEHMENDAEGFNVTLTSTVGEQSDTFWIC